MRGSRPPGRRTSDRRPPAGTRREAAASLGAAIALVALLGACGSSSARDASRGVRPGSGATAAGAAPTAHRGSGPVDVLYAGSLVDLMEQRLGPGFHAATGYSFDGFAGGSRALATEISGKVRVADVFVSASPGVNASLEGPENGNWVAWYATFANSPLVLGYNPHGSFARALRTRPWYDVVTEPGFLLGRTDPAVDPKGKLAVEALEGAAAAHGVAALSTLAGSKSGVFTEESLVGRLQAGQLDAGFFYSSEAKAAGIPTVPLTGETLKATYTVTVVARAPHEAGAEAFVAYLLGPAGRAMLAKDGFDLVTAPAVHGTGVPAGLRSALAGA